MEPVTAVAAWGFWKAVTWIVGLGVAAYATHKVTSTFGVTPQSQLKDLGIPPERIYNDAKKFNEDKVEYLNGLNKKDNDDIKALTDKVEKLENEKVTMQGKLNDYPKDSPEYKKLVAQIAGIESRISTFNSQIEEKKGRVAEREEKVTKTFTALGDTSNKTEFLSRAKGIQWGEYKNWAIIFVCIVVVIMVIGLIKKLFSSLLSSIKQ